MPKDLDIPPRVKTGHVRFFFPELMAAHFIQLSTSTTALQMLRVDVWG